MKKEKNLWNFLHNPEIPPKKLFQDQRKFHTFDYNFEKLIFSFKTDFEQNIHPWPRYWDEQAGQWAEYSGGGGEGGLVRGSNNTYEQREHRITGPPVITSRLRWDPTHFISSLTKNWNIQEIEFLIFLVGYTNGHKQIFYRSFKGCINIREPLKNG